MELILPHPPIMKKHFVTIITFLTLILLIYTYENWSRIWTDPDPVETRADASEEDRQLRIVTAAGFTPELPPIEKPVPEAITIPPIIVPVDSRDWEMHKLLPAEEEIEEFKPAIEKPIARKPKPKASPRPTTRATPRPEPAVEPKSRKGLLKWLKENRSSEYRPPSYSPRNAL